MVFDYFSAKFKTFEIRSKYESLGRKRWFCPYLRDFTLIFEIIFEVDKFHQKAKGLTHGF